MNASWDWCTDGRLCQANVSIKILDPPSPPATLCVLVTPWLCSAQRQQTCGILCQLDV